MDTMFGKVEAVVKNLCAFLLYLVVCNQSRQFFGNSSGVQLCMAGFFQQFKGCFQQVSGLHIGIACFHGAMNETKEHASPKTLG